MTASAARPPTSCRLTRSTPDSSIRRPNSTARRANGGRQDCVHGSPHTFNVATVSTVGSAITAPFWAFRSKPARSNLTTVNVRTGEGGIMRGLVGITLAATVGCLAVAAPAQAATDARTHPLRVSIGDPYAG